ncbi:MAG: radical SAM family heme chaperone HemW [Clostridia bacterium]|nr:radical SAM family heme chaperone HemW [Clostridia bacterium]
MEENQKPMGLYVHIPFCSKKCDYCDFVSYSMDRKAQQLYLEALFTEIDRVKRDFQDRVFNSLFIGGGTPSIVYEGFIASLARKLFSSFHFEEKTEFTIEINPSSFTREKFFEYVEAGVNRISVGVQCLDSRLLANNGRIQSVENVQETFEILRDSRFLNVNGDVMIGLPGQSEQAVLDTIKFLTDHNVKHISCYTLQIEKYTMLYNKIQKGKIAPMPEKQVLHINEKVAKYLEKQGFKRYEISNYAKPCFECNHNKKYWDGTDYLGLGTSAHSFVDGYRFYNTKRLDTYIDAMREGKSATYKKEYISKAERRTERIMLSLRTAEGLDLNQFKQDFNEDLTVTRLSQIKKLKEINMLEEVDGFLRIPETKFNVSNSIIVELL